MPADPYLGGLLVSSMGAFYSREEADLCAESMTNQYEERHWVASLRTYPELAERRWDDGRWEQLELPWEVIRPRGQSEWGIDLALETAHRWS